jgi:UDP-N-acetylglucosamine 2-epimerase (non-hydrolysing)
LITRVLSVLGTRPEAIKMAPVILALAQSDDFESLVCVTAQHRQMLDQALSLFNIQPDYDLDIMQQGQDLYEVTASSLIGLRDVLRQEQPDIVLVQGDTTSCFSGALAAFYEHIPVGHVEAGLRTGDLGAPFPEEGNRSMVGRIANWHFAPTEQSRRNLLSEAVSDSRIWVTGNTVIDALLLTRDKVNAFPEEYWENYFDRDLFRNISDMRRRMILITGHRRENFGQGFIDLCSAIRDLAVAHRDWDLVYPVHLNQNVQQPVYEILEGQKNIFLLQPQDYASFVWLMNQADMILTDSGGVQEEAPSLGKPVLVMREVTERPEAVDAGTVRLVGTDRKRIVQEVEHLMLDENQYELMSRAHNPYGKGDSAQLVISALRETFMANAKAGFKKTIFLRPRCSGYRPARLHPVWARQRYRNQPVPGCLLAACYLALAGPDGWSGGDSSAEIAVPVTAYATRILVWLATSAGVVVL